MRDLQQRHSRLVQTGRNGYHLLHRNLVPHGMHPITQAHVVQLDLMAANLFLERHYAASSLVSIWGRNEPSWIL